MHNENDSHSPFMASTGSVSSWDESLLVAMIQYPVPVIKGPKISRPKSIKSAKQLRQPRPAIQKPI